jgi:uncharacterized iron-regulated membrane protein
LTRLRWVRARVGNHWGLHYGDIRDNLAYRTFVCFFGLVIATLSVTGVYIWWKKRKGRLLAASRRLE